MNGEVVKKFMQVLLCGLHVGVTVSLYGVIGIGGCFLMGIIIMVY